ncbi:hypothetical protein [Photobacterium leiognathi]|uniref:hypothetical protein n=1 Tax=Photobacterium leiognathi TaxID=553611 RepID=UPI0029819B0D|nr:hypothetical protein [Photobacterium leiognathi]
MFKKNHKISFFLSSVFVFLLFLQNLGTYKIIFPLLVIFFIISISFKNDIKISAKSFWITITLIIYLTVDIGISVYHAYPIDISYIRSLYVSFFVFLFTVNFYENKLSLLGTAIDFVLWISVSVWVYQFISLYATGTAIDPIGIITGIPARMESPPYLPFKLWRPAGLTWEPGTYATFMSLLLYSSYLINKKVKIIYVLTVLTFFLSLSVFAVIFGAIFICAISKEYLLKNKLVLILFLFFILLFVDLVFKDYILYRFVDSKTDDKSLLIKQYAVHYWINQDIYRQLFGSRFSHNDCNCLVRDSTLFFNMIYTFGVSGFVIMLTFIKKMSYSITSTLFILSIFISKMMIFSPLIWFAFGVFYLVKGEYENKVR